MRPLLMLVAALATLGVTRDNPPVERSLDARISWVWTAGNVWSDEEEKGYSDFVGQLGSAVEAQRCDRLDRCLADPEANLLFEPDVDANLRLGVDCADLPYVLRAYYAFKRDLPFGFVSEARSAGGWDPRLGVGVIPIGWRTWRDYPTPRILLREMTRLVHSGMYRVAAAADDGDFYPVRIDRASLVPGAIFYDPMGHVSVLGRARPDGVVFFISGSPDGSLTWKRFGSSYTVGSAAFGGGFKRFRPIVREGQRLVRVPNEDLADFDADTQYAVATERRDFHRWVRDQLADPAIDYDPVADLRDQVRALCRDVSDRIAAVDLAVAAGLPARPHPAHLPANIYAADGAWEIYATAARDVRLRSAFYDLTDAMLAIDDLPAMGPLLWRAWDEELAAPACQLAYHDSRGELVRLGLGDVLDRLFALSFDPAHCPELRWGAPEGSTELESCPDDEGKRAWYRAEGRLRNRLERSYGYPTPLEGGPEETPAIDVRRLFGPRLPDLDL